MSKEANNTWCVTCWSGQQLYSLARSSVLKESFHFFRLYPFSWFFPFRHSSSKRCSKSSRPPGPRCVCQTRTVSGTQTFYWSNLRAMHCGQEIYTQHLCFGIYVSGSVSTGSWSSVESLHNHLSVRSSHWGFVDDPAVFVSPVNSLFSEMKVEQDGTSHPGHEPPLVLPVKIHPMNGFTMAEYHEGLWDWTKRRKTSRVFHESYEFLC